MSGPLRGKISDIFLEIQNTDGAQATNLSLVFWGKDTHASWLMGEETVSATGEVIAVADGAKTNIVHLGGLNIPYTDLDNTAEWHISLTAGNTITTGEVSLAFNFIPEYPA